MKIDRLVSKLRIHVKPDEDSRAFAIGIISATVMCLADTLFDFLFEKFPCPRIQFLGIKLIAFPVVAFTIYMIYFRLLSPKQIRQDTRPNASEISIRLATLKSLKGKKIISDDEYKIHRERILSEI